MIAKDSEKRMILTIIRTRKQHVKHPKTVFLFAMEMSFNLVIKTALFFIY